MTDTFPRGRFIWYELMTSDPSAAQSFYTQLIGWTTKDGEIADQPYTEWMNGETPVGGVMQLPDEAKQQGAPPHWLAYGGVRPRAERSLSCQKRGCQRSGPGGSQPRRRRRCGNR